MLQSVDGQRAGLGLAGIHQVLRAQALRRGVVFIGPFGDRRVLHVLRRGFLDALQELLGILVAAAVHIGEEQRLLGRDAVDVARAGLGQRLFVADDRLVVAFLVRVGVAGRNQHVGVHRRIGGAQPLVQLDGVRVAAAQAQAVDHVADHRRAQRRILGRQRQAVEQLPAIGQRRVQRRETLGSGQVPGFGARPAQALGDRGMLQLRIFQRREQRPVFGGQVQRQIGRAAAAGLLHLVPHRRGRGRCRAHERQPRHQQPSPPQATHGCGPGTPGLIVVHRTAFYENARSAGDVAD
ncbi:Uncharacterised protein [Bordetella pertussis]|nr:Uncharacterised protein [Bordetella pertussis]CPM61027.1 Uncharacterised protein [Bordetella pertussis]